jgi:hypothetical protein
VPPKIGSSEDDALVAWLRANYSKLPSNVRVPIIYGVLNHAGVRGVVVQIQPADVKAPPPPEPVVQKFDEINPRYQGLLFAITLSGDEKFGRFFAEQVA